MSWANNNRYDPSIVDEPCNAQSNGKPRMVIPPPQSLRTLIADHPAMKPIVIGGLLRLGEVMNVIASPKRGKSWLGYGIALSVNDGRHWLDTFPCSKGRVLILDAELHPEGIAHRIPTVATAMQLKNLENDDYRDMIDVMPLRGLGVDLITLGSIIRAIKPGRYMLVILDAWYRFLPTGHSENDNAQVMSLYNLIDSYAAHLQSAWINIHHTSKGDQSGKATTDVGSGAGSQSRAADTHLIIRPHEEENVAVIEAAVRSFPPVAPLAVRWEFPLWLPDSADPRKLKGLQSNREQAAKQAREVHLDEDRKAIIRAMVANKTEPQTMSFIRSLSRVGNPRFGYAWASLISDQTILPAGEVRKGNNRPYESFTLKSTESDE